LDLLYSAREFGEGGGQAVVLGSASKTLATVPQLQQERLMVLRVISQRYSDYLKLTVSDDYWSDKGIGRAISLKGARWPYFLHNLISEKGQVTIPKHIWVAAGVAPGSEVSFSLDGGKIVITPLSTSVKNDRREMVRQAAARVRAGYSTEFWQLGADEIVNFLRGESVATRILLDSSRLDASS
jgi:antitoxin PrlF